MNGTSLVIGNHAPLLGASYKHSHEACLTAHAPFGAPSKQHKPRKGDSSNEAFTYAS